MRNLPPEISDSIANFTSFIYCFEITLREGKCLFLTSSPYPITNKDKIFLPGSGITIKEGIFNDSAKDHLILEGIFEENGIDKQMELTEAETVIFICFSNHFYHLFTYRCTVYTKCDLSFTIYLEPETIKYGQSLLMSFSKTCRAVFGDRKCKIDKNFYSKIYTIAKIINSQIELVDLNQENGHFNDGEAIIADGKFKAKVLSHSGNIVSLDQPVPNAFKHHQNIILISGCDKKFITCCNKFDNAVNFRGEPLIPEYNFLKINQ